MVDFPKTVWLGCHGWSSASSFSLSASKLSSSLELSDNPANVLCAIFSALVLSIASESSERAGQQPSSHQPSGFVEMTKLKIQSKFNRPEKPKMTNTKQATEMAQ